ncbi:cytochrome b [Solimonas terrae]|uniref:Cytochrome b n=1 Tax=Solimonas terrae TaxID=1396819 RepID=A0A6M2BVR8_9GAMM|nr:cytochrome b [Solimonas terrae]
MTTHSDGYSAPAKLGHWLIALLLIASYSIAWTMVDLRMSPTRLRLFNYHKWVGVTIFALAVLRLLWRLLQRPPPLPAAMPPWERQAAAIVHRLLYLLLFALPLSGWLMSSAKGFQTVYFGRWPIPDAIGKNAALGAALTSVHVALTWLLLALVATHVLAALKHQFVDRDAVLRRMLPRLPRRHSSEPS